MEIDLQKLVQKAGVDFHREIHNLVKTNLTLTELLNQSTEAFIGETKDQSDKLKQLVKCGLHLQEQAISLKSLRTEVRKLKQLGHKKLQAQNNKLAILKKAKGASIQSQKQGKVHDQSKQQRQS